MQHDPSARNHLLRYPCLKPGMWQCHHCRLTALLLLHRPARAALVADARNQPPPQHTPTLPPGLLSIHWSLRLFSAKLVLQLLAFTSSITFCPWPCILVARPPCAATMVSQGFDTVHKINPAYLIVCSGLVRLCASTAYSSNSCSASHKSCNTLGQLPPLLLQTWQFRAVSA